jgi:peptide-methionine (S)-S-oxide reductase
MRIRNVETGTKQIVLGGGCFWCTEAIFDMLRGVIRTTPGYAGGHAKNPTYKEVCSGSTGHAEVLKIEYSAKAISLEKLLEVFFSMHDPTSVNQQGADVGSQYRSIILYTDEADRRIIGDYIARIAGSFKKPIATEVKKLDAFYPSEDYHKDYYKRNPLQPYCMFVIRPKISKTKKEFSSELKP